MNPEDVQRLIEAEVPGCEAIVSGDGSHFDAIVISESFQGKSLVDKQRMVYASVNARIASGELHALSIKAYTPAEWDKARKLRVSS